MTCIRVVLCLNSGNIPLCRLREQHVIKAGLSVPTSSDLIPHNKAYARNNKSSFEQKIRICKHIGQNLGQYYEKSTKKLTKDEDVISLPYLLSTRFTAQGSQHICS